MRIAGMAVGSRPWARVTGGLVLVLVLAACGSSTSSASSPAASGRSSTPAKVTSTGSMTSAGLVAQLKAGATSVTSAHLSMSTTAGGQSVLAVEADEILVDGRLTAMSLKEKVGSIHVSILMVDGAVFVKLPSSENKSGKLWAKATTRSTNPVLKELASSISSIQEGASLTQYEAFAGAASHFRTIAVEKVNGASATHYSMMVDVTKVQGAAMNEAMKKSLAQTGITKIPVDLWVDEQGRTVKVAERFKVQGQALSVDIGLTRINEPVTIVAPPASEVLADSDVSTT